MTQGVHRRGACAMKQVAALTAACLTIGACTSDTTRGTASTEGDVGGLPVSEFESGPIDDAPEPGIRVDNASTEETDATAIAASADLTDYWTQAFGPHFDSEFEPVERLLSFDSDTDDMQLCGASVAGQINAFYCPEEDAVAWDRGALLPLLDDQFGPMGILTVIAHEYGHAIQHRIEDQAGVSATTPTVVLELQADCFTGNYFRWAAEEHSDYFAVSTAEGIDNALSALHFVRDDPGDLRHDVDAHGTAFDRTYAFQRGFEQDPAACAEIDERLVEQWSTQQKFSEQDTRGGDLSINRDTIGLVEESLDAAFAEPGIDLPDIVTDDGHCPDGSATPPAAYCPENNTVSIDLDGLAEIARPIDRRAEWDGAEIEGFGDFAAFASIASRYVMAVQRAAGESLTEIDAGLHSACLVGAWADSANEPRGEERILRLSPGDLDEAVLELLQPNSLIASTVDGVAVPGGFSRVEALRTGFVDGQQACADTYS